jgi:transcriptional regulator with XRE-family HTH domain
MKPESFKASRTRLNLSRAAFARQLGIAPNTATAYEHGRSPIPVYIALAIAALLYGLPPAV